MANAPEEHEAKMPYAKGEEEMGEQLDKPTENSCESHHESQDKQSEQQAGEEKQYEPVAVLPLRNLTVLNVINFVLSLLIEYAWQKMGLLANPVTGKIERNIEEARFAIDTIAILLEHVKPRLDGREYDQLRQTLTTLRINYVEQAGKGEGES